MNIPPEYFLIDANALITPYKSYYPFDFAPHFWSQLEACFLNGRVKLLDVVKHEIEAGGDALSEWIKSKSFPPVISRNDAKIIAAYSDIMEYIQKSVLYKQRALTDWAQVSVADPWLIAAAKVYGLTVVTFETASRGLSVKTPNSRVKIPDICKAFDVKYENLFYMMRELKFNFG